VGEAVWWCEGPLDGAVPPTVAAVGDGLGNVGVNGPAHYHEHDMAGREPDEHKEAEHDVGESVMAYVFQALGDL